LVAGFSILAKDKPGKNLLMASDTVVWTGLDYSLVRMIGADDFKIPDAIFPGMLEKWNTLFIDERIERVANVLGKRVAIDIGGVTERNKMATAKQIILTPSPKDVIEETHITRQDIADEVKSYKLEKTSGLGLVFIVDRLVFRTIPPQYLHSSSRTEAAGAVYVVFFDISTREVISTEREIQQARGSGFRNFWFGVIKRTDSNLSKYRSSGTFGRKSSR
jgi:hypothetical protein